MKTFTIDKQFGTKDFRRAVSGLNGVKACKRSKNDFFWEITPDEVNFQEVDDVLNNFDRGDVCYLINIIKSFKEKAIAEESVKDLQDDSLMKKMESTSNYAFSEFVDKVAHNNKMDMTTYTVIGDIINGFKCHNNSFLFDFLDNHNERQSIKLFICENTKIITKDAKEEVLSLEKLNDKRVKVSGKVNLSHKYINMEMIADKIEILGICSRKEEIKCYEKECSLFFHDLSEQKKFSIDNLTDIGLIPGADESGKYIKGASDFIECLQNQLKDNIHEVPASISDISSIISAIEKLNHEGKCQVIAVVRGGGSDESMICYSDPKLVKAIYESPIPVITGIGHQSDNFLCERAACRSFGTPTAAGKFLNSQFFKNHPRMSKREQKLLAENKELKVELNKLLEKNKSISEEKDKMEKDNEFLVREIDSLKHRNLFKRILNQ